jgi:flagellar hook-basal body complex protein FliE
MVQPINPVQAELRLAQILGDDYLAQAPQGVAAPAVPAAPGGTVEFSGNMFEDVLAKSIEALNGVSQTEMHANQLIQGYLRGEVELHDVMLAQSKMSIMVQLAVTTVNAAVTSFKEITQMQV